MAGKEVLVRLAASAVDAPSALALRVDQADPGGIFWALAVVLLAGRKRLGPRVRPWTGRRPPQTPTVGPMFLLKIRALTIPEGCMAIHSLVAVTEGRVAEQR